MTNEQFREELTTIRETLEKLSQYPQFKEICDWAVETGNFTLREAAEGIGRASYYYEREPSLQEFQEVEALFEW